MHSCGIDFGTSNSSIVTAQKDAVRLVALEDGKDTLPSAIFFPASGAPHFGRQAQKLFFEAEEGRFMRSLKRILGTSLMGQGTAVNGRMMKFEDIIGRFISFMKDKAESSAGQSLDSVVMGRPVHFIDNDPEGDARAQDQLEKIARAAGFENVSFQFEPIAAAFSHERKITGEKLAIVADVGGGTSDFTVIRLSPDRMDKHDRNGDILGNAGVRTGGNDFDKAFSLSAFMPEFGIGSTYGVKKLAVPLSPFHEMSEWSKINFLYTPKNKADMHDIHAQSHARLKFGRFVHALDHELGHRILSAVEETKIALTSAPSANTPLDFVEEGFGIKTDIGAFDKSVEEHIAHIGDALSECLAGAGVQTNNIEMVILTGGPTETPALKHAICRRFENAHISEENRLSSVALGLGHDSLRVFA